MLKIAEKVAKLDEPPKEKQTTDRKELTPGGK